MNNRIIISEDTWKEIMRRTEEFRQGGLKDSYIFRHDLENILLSMIEKE